MKTQWTWRGEANRRLAAYRPCWCGCDYRDAIFGVGYVSASDSNGNGFTIWIEDERIYLRLEAALNKLRPARLRRQKKKRVMQ